MNNNKEVRVVARKKSNKEPKKEDMEQGDGGWSEIFYSDIDAVGEDDLSEADQVKENPSPKKGKKKSRK